MAATVLVFVAVGGGDGTDEGAVDGGGSEWIAGLVLILGPLSAAAVTRLVAGSRLLRPVGAAATAVAVGCSLLHLAVAVDEQGWAGWLYAAPAITTGLLLAAAVVRGPDRTAPSRSRPSEGVSAGPPTAALSADADVAGPPLDVLTPLRHARDHAARSLAAWLAVLVLLGVVGVPALRLIGRPVVVAHLEARVVEVKEIAGRTAVTFRATHGERRLEWRRVSDADTWRPGARTVAYLDDDDRVHDDQQFGLAGSPLVLPALILGVFVLASARRLWALVVAWWDARGGGDRPVLGYAAVIDDPAPRTWRPLVAVWRSDPGREGRLRRPDGVYRADDEVGDLRSPASRVVVRRAWIDTGLWPRAKPRWIGTEGGVVVPHRRSLLGSTYVRAITRRSDVRRAVALRHGPPDPSARRTQERAPDRTTRFGVLVAWRLVALVVALGLAAFEADGGRPAHIVGGSPGPSTAGSDRG